MKKLQILATHAAIMGRAAAGDTGLFLTTYQSVARLLAAQASGRADLVSHELADGIVRDPCSHEIRAALAYQIENTLSQLHVHLVGEVRQFGKGTHMTGGARRSSATHTHSFDQRRQSHDRLTRAQTDGGLSAIGREVHLVNDDASVLGILTPFVDVDALVASELEALEAKTSPAFIEAHVGFDIVVVLESDAVVSKLDRHISERTAAAVFRNRIRSRLSEAQSDATTELEGRTVRWDEDVPDGLGNLIDLIEISTLAEAADDGECGSHFGAVLRFESGFELALGAVMDHVGDIKIWHTDAGPEPTLRTPRDTADVDLLAEAQNLHTEIKALREVDVEAVLGDLKEHVLIGFDF